MINGPKYKICRRLGAGVFEKCQTQKFVMSEARHTGKKGGKKPKQLSAFGSQLIEKQKVRFSYGLTEKQFSNYVKSATETKGIVAGEKLFEDLENRLDNVIYRLGIAHTRSLARQIVSHGHIVINGKRTTVPSYKTRVGDTIIIREGSRKSPLFTDIDKKLKNYSVPTWLSFDLGKIEAKIVGKPKNTEGFFNFNAVFEYYSR